MSSWPFAFSLFRFPIQQEKKHSQIKCPSFLALYHLLNHSIQSKEMVLLYSFLSGRGMRLFWVLSWMVTVCAWASRSAAASSGR